MNSIFPPIISNKIDWYSWKYKQNKLCIEYHQKYELMDNFYMVKKKSPPSNSFNDRLLNEYCDEESIGPTDYHENIYTMDSHRSAVSKIPTNYYYSNGSRIKHKYA
jgi:hypothetical protein